MYNTSLAAIGPFQLAKPHINSEDPCGFYIRDSMVPSVTLNREADILSLELSALEVKPSTLVPFFQYGLSTLVVSGLLLKLVLS